MQFKTKTYKWIKNINGNGDMHTQDHYFNSLEEAIEFLKDGDFDDAKIWEFGVLIKTLKEILEIYECETYA